MVKRMAFLAAIAGFASVFLSGCQSSGTFPQSHWYGVHQNSRFYVPAELQ